MSLSSARYRLLPAVPFLALWIALAIEPRDRGDWLLENLLVVVFAALLVAYPIREVFPRVFDARGADDTPYVIGVSGPRAATTTSQQNRRTCGCVGHCLGPVLTFEK